MLSGEWLGIRDAFSLMGRRDFEDIKEIARTRARDTTLQSRSQAKGTKIQDINDL